MIAIDSSKTTSFINKLYLVLMIFWSLSFIGCYSCKIFAPDYFATRWMDFCKFYSAAEVMASGRGHKLYDPYLQRQYLTKLIYPTVPGPVQELNGQPAWEPQAEQPPFFLALYTPLTLIPPPVGLAIATLVFWLAGLSGLLFLSNAAQTLNRTQVFIVFLLASGSLPGIWNFVLGQESWLIVAVVSIYLAFSLKHQDKAAGWMLAFSAIKLQYAPFLGLAPVMLGRGRLLISLLIGALFLLIVSFWLTGEALLSYPKLILTRAGNRAYAGGDITMPTLRGLLSATAPQWHPILVGTVLCIIALVALAALWRQTKRTGADQRWAWAITIVAATLFNPHTARYDLLLLTIPAVLTLTSLDCFKPETSIAARLWKIVLVLYPGLSLSIHLSSMPEALKTALSVFIQLLLLATAIQCWTSTAQSSNQEATASSAAIT